MDGKMVGKTSGRLVKTGCWWIPLFSLISVTLSFISSVTGFRENSAFYWGSNQATPGKMIRETMRSFHDFGQIITL